MSTLFRGKQTRLDCPCKCVKEKERQRDGEVHLKKVFFCVTTALLEAPAASVSLKIEATHSFVTLVMTNSNKLCYTPEGNYLNFHCHENLTCHINLKRVCNITHRLFQKCVWEKHIIQNTGSQIPGACGTPGKFTFFLVAHQKLNKELQFIMRIQWLLQKCQLLRTKCNEDGQW